MKAVKAAQRQRKGGQGKPSQRTVNERQASWAGKARQWSGTKQIKTKAVKQGRVSAHRIVVGAGEYEVARGVVRDRVDAVRVLYALIPAGGERGRRGASAAGAAERAK